MGKDNEHMRMTDEYTCPICGEECTELYFNDDDEIVGCNVCIEDKSNVCPVCGNECEKLYYGPEENVIGCECCVSRREVWDYLEEMDEIARDQYEDWKLQEILGK